MNLREHSSRVHHHDMIEVKHALEFVEDIIQ
jgi:hypothetical protein